MVQKICVSYLLHLFRLWLRLWLLWLWPRLQRRRWLDLRNRKRRRLDFRDRRTCLPLLGLLLLLLALALLLFRLLGSAHLPLLTLLGGRLLSPLRCFQPALLCLSHRQHGAPTYWVRWVECGGRGGELCVHIG